MKRKNILTVVLGIGNRLRGDDGAGSIIADLVKNKNKSLISIDSGTTPENHIGKIVKINPDRVILIDTANFNGKPGEYKIIKEEDIDYRGFSTHTLPISMIVEQLKLAGIKDISLIGIQPENTTFGHSISCTVDKAITEISTDILKGNI